MKDEHWLAGEFEKNDPDVVGCESHQKVAEEIAMNSITLVRDHSQLIPINLPATKRIAVVFPTPMDLTPADTSSYVSPTLGKALRKYHPHVDEFIISQSPTAMEICNIMHPLWKYDMIIIGTINAFDKTQQAVLVREVLLTGIPTIVVALRLPYDLAVFPEAKTYVSTYTILEPSMIALASALFGKSKFKGHLPVSIPGLYTAVASQNN